MGFGRKEFSFALPRRKRKGLEHGTSVKRDFYRFLEWKQGKERNLVGIESPTAPKSI